MSRKGIKAYLEKGKLWLRHNEHLRPSRQWSWGSKENATAFPVDLAESLSYELGGVVRVIECSTVIAPQTVGALRRKANQDGAGRAGHLLTNAERVARNRQSRRRKLT